MELQPLVVYSVVTVGPSLTDEPGVRLLPNGDKRDELEVTPFSQFKLKVLERYSRLKSCSRVKVSPTAQRVNISGGGKRDSPDRKGMKTEKRRHSVKTPATVGEE